MRHVTTVLVALLVATNGAWIAWWSTRGDTSAPTSGAASPPESGVERADLQAEVARLRRELDLRTGPPVARPRTPRGEVRTESPVPAPPPSAQTSARAPERPDAGSPAAASPRPASQSSFAPGAAETFDPVARKAALDTLTRAKDDVLQIRDLAQRERGLVAVGDALRSPDPQVAASALGLLGQFRDVVYDKRRFRADVLELARSTDPGLAMQAAFAFINVEREPGDLDRVLAFADATTVPSAGVLRLGLALNADRAEGKVGELFVRALAVREPPGAAEQTANLLRRTWVDASVEAAVVDAWRRRVKDASRGEGLWQYVFGQMRPVREVRVRAIFEMMDGAGPEAESVRQLAGVALWREPVDEPARPVAAQLALAALDKAQNALFRKSYIDIVRVNGTSHHAAALRALAGNTMLAEETRTLAADAATQLERR